MLGKSALNYLSASKLTSHLPYAFVEMLLLVVGILVALQIDNWNESRKDAVLEGQYYCRLYESVLLDHAQLKRLQAEMDARFTAGTEMLAELQREHPDRTLVATKMVASIRLAGSNFRPDTSAFEDIKSSGNINVLKDTDIKDQISRYYSDVTSIANNHTSNSEYTSQRFFGHNDVIGAGWLEIEFMKIALDGSAVDIEKLVSRYPYTQAIIDSLIADSIFYIAINARGLDHLQDISSHIVDLTQALEKKCDAAI